MAGRACGTHPAAPLGRAAEAGAHTCRGIRLGALETVSQIAAPAGQALAGVLGQVMPLPLLFGGSGAVCVLLAGLYAVVPALRLAFEAMDSSPAAATSTAGGGAATQAVDVAAAPAPPS